MIHLDESYNSDKFTLQVTKEEYHYAERKVNSMGKTKPNSENVWWCCHENNNSGSQRRAAPYWDGQTHRYLDVRKLVDEFLYLLYSFSAARKAVRTCAPSCASKYPMRQWPGAKWIVDTIARLIYGPQIGHLAAFRVQHQPAVEFQTNFYPDWNGVPFRRGELAVLSSFPPWY